MRAIAVVPGTKGAAIIDVPEPDLRDPDEARLKIVRVGICGTDREEYAGGRALAEKGRKELVIGHEMLGRVVETGKSVTGVKQGDYAVFTVRRGCGECLPCLMNRSDMCETGRYRERGIWGRDGYQTEYAVDTQQYLVRVPESISDIAVLCEPTAVAEKAIQESILLQTRRLPDALANPDWPGGKRCLLAGLGPIGLLAAMVLKLKGCLIYGLDIVDPGSARPKWFEQIGGTYLDGRKVRPEDIQKQAGPIDLIFDATGVAKLEFDLLDALGRNGVYVLTGIPGGDKQVQIDAGALIRKLVLNNQIMLGSVNDAPGHFKLAVNDLYAAHLRWGDHVRGLITHRFKPEEYDKALGSHDANEIKAVIEWSK